MASSGYGPLTALPNFCAGEGMAIVFGMPGKRHAIAGHADPLRVI